MKHAACTFCLLTALSLSATALAQSSATTGNGVTVIDLDAVAVALGWNVALQEAVETKDQELQQQLADRQQNLQSQLDEITASFGADRTAEQTTTLQNMTNQAQGVYQNALQQAQQTMAQYQTTLISNIREKIRPFAKQVAEEQGCSIILSKGEMVYHVSAAGSITDAVIARMLSAHMKDSKIVENLPEAAPAE